MALEDSVIKSEQSYIELTGAENLSPYSSASSYGEQASYYQTEYDWHQQRQHHLYQSHEQQPQSHVLQTTQLSDLSTRQYYPSYETHELTPVATYPAFSQHSLHQSDFYSQVLWPGSQQDHIPPGSLATPPRLFSGVDVSQHVVMSGPQSSTQPQAVTSTKPKRKRVQSYSQRKAANVRERRRMFHLNEAFDVLRKRLPAFNYEKRLSRIETLRLAMTYISFMKDVSVGEDPKCVKLKPHGLELGSPGPMSALLNQDTSFSNMDSLSNDYSGGESSNDAKSLHNGAH